MSFAFANSLDRCLLQQRPLTHRAVVMHKVRPSSGKHFVFHEHQLVHVPHEVHLIGPDDALEGSLCASLVVLGAAQLPGVIE